MKKKISIILNSLIIFFEIIGIIYSISFNHRVAIDYYTEESNILALITSILFLVYVNKGIPNWVKMFKYISTIGVSVTFFVVLFILLPMVNFNVYAMFFDGTLLYHHFLCPILGVVTFIWFDDLGEFNKKDSLFGLIHTCIYAVVMIILNLLRLYDGPYPFLRVYDQGIIMSIIWLIIIFGLAYLISSLLRIIKKKVDINGSIGRI